MQVTLYKYDNRKIYTKAGDLFNKGSYISLDEIKDLIKIGYDIKVKHVKTNEDLTSKVLSELINKHVSLDLKTKVKLIKGELNV